MKKKKYYWKCQDCGLTYGTSTKNEPRRGCPCCKKKGVKDFRGIDIYSKGDK